LVIEVGSADVMSTLIILKHEVEERRGSVMRMVFSGATESHLIAAEIGEIYPFSFGLLTKQMYTSQGGSRCHPQSREALSFDMG
jgi:hypothetical protein